jgi:hypothetical protein
MAWTTALAKFEQKGFTSGSKGLRLELIGGREDGSIFASGKTGEFVACLALPSPSRL